MKEKEYDERLPSLADGAGYALLPRHRGFLIDEHTAHIFGVLPYALVLLYPLLHLFMHGGQGGRPGDRGSGG